MWLFFKPFFSKIAHIDFLKTKKCNIICLRLFKKPKIPTMKEEIAEIVRRRRKERGLSQEGLAELAGVSRSFIKSLEAGKTNVRLDLLLLVLDLFGIELQLQESS